MTPRGSIVAPFHRLDFAPVRSVKEFQVIQEAVDRFGVRAVVSPAYTEEEGRRFAEVLQDGLGYPLAVEVEPVEALPRTARGKLQLVECLVSE